MRVITTESYKCEICGTAYSSRSLAQECEVQGVPEAKFSIGQAVDFKEDNDKGELKVVEKIYVSSDHGELNKLDMAELLSRVFDKAANKVLPHQTRYIIKYLNIRGLSTSAGEEELELCKK